MYYWGRFVGILASIVFLSAAGGAAAQEPPEMTLPQLISLALKFSPQVKTSQSDVTLAEAQKAEVRGYRFPQLDAVALGGLVPKADLPRIVNNRIFYPDPKSKIHGMTVFGRLDFRLIQPLYTFGKISHREKAAAKNIKVKTAKVDTTRAEVILHVSKAFYGLVLAQQGEDAVRDARGYLSDAKERITRLLAVKSASVKDTDPYRLAVYEGGVEKFAAEAEEGAKVAYRALQALIGYSPKQEFRVPLELPEPTPPAGKLDHFVLMALELRPEFTMLKEGKAARELLVKAAKADYYPDFFAGVIGFLAGAPGRRTSQDPFHQDYFNEAGAGPVLGIKWHFDFGITKAKLRQARAELNKLQHQKRTALMGIPIQVAKAYGKVTENYRASKGMLKAYVNARRWIITAFSNFDIGLGTMTDIFVAFERYGIARGDYLLALFNYHLAVAELNKATGAYRRTLPKEAPPKAKKPGRAAG